MYVIRIGTDGYYEEERYPAIVPIELATKMEYTEAYKTLTQFRKFVAPGTKCNIEQFTPNKRVTHDARRRNKSRNSSSNNDLQLSR